MSTSSPSAPLGALDHAPPLPRGPSSLSHLLNFIHIQMFILNAFKSNNRVGFKGIKNVRSLHPGEKLIVL